jgi:hypothetical protein
MGSLFVYVHLDDEFELFVVGHAKWVWARCSELGISVERRFGYSRVTNWSAARRQAGSDHWWPRQLPHGA